MIALVIGGAASGKSAYAERVCTGLPFPVTYLATMEKGGAEAEARIKRHRALRSGKGFATLERSHGLALIEDPPRGTVLLECLGTLVANELFAAPETDQNDALARVMAGIDALAQAAQALVVVSNDVFADGFAYDAGTEAYRCVLAAANAGIAERAAHVVEVVAGIPRPVKGALL